MVDSNGLVSMEPLSSSPEALRGPLRRTLSSSTGFGAGPGSPSAGRTSPSGTSRPVPSRGGSRGASVRSESAPASDAVDFEPCDPWDPRIPLDWWSDNGMTRAAPQSMQRSSYTDTAAGRHIAAPMRTFRDDEKKRIWEEALRGNPAGPMSSQTRNRIDHRDMTKEFIPGKRLFQVSQGQIAALMKANATLGAERRAEMLFRKTTGCDGRKSEKNDSFRRFSPEEMAQSRGEPTITNWGPTNTEPAPHETGGRKFAKSDKLMESWNPRVGTAWGVQRCGH